MLSEARKHLKKAGFIKGMIALLAALPLPGCLTPRAHIPLETSVEISEGYPSFSPIGKIITCGELLGSDVDEVERLYGYPNSTSIINSGGKFFSRMRFWSVRFLGKTADLEIDKYQHKVMHVKIKFLSVPPLERGKLIDELAEGFSAIYGNDLVKSQSVYRWKDENADLVKISLHGSSIIISYGDEDWFRPERAFEKTDVLESSEDIHPPEEKDKAPPEIGREENPLTVENPADEKKVENPLKEEQISESGEELPTKEDVQSLPGENLEVPASQSFIDERFRISGYIQALGTYYESGPASDNLKIERARVKLTGELLQELSYFIQIDSADTSDILRDAYIMYQKSMPLRIIVGQAKIPFSEEQLRSSSELYFTRRSEAISQLSEIRDIGIQLRGDFFNNRASYGTGVFNGAGMNASDNNDSKDIVGRIVFTPFRDIKLLEDFSIGGAFQHGSQPRILDTQGERTVFGGLLKYEYDKLNLEGEYLLRAQERIPGLSDRDSKGWYAMAAYYLLPELQAAVRYEQYDEDDNISGDREDILTLGVNYYFNDYLKLQANYLLKEEQAGELTNNQFDLLLQLTF